MCLSKIWTDEEMAEWLEGQGEVIEVEKIVFNCFGGNPSWAAPCESISYKGGLNKAKTEKRIKGENAYYFLGFHFYYEKNGSLRWMKSTTKKAVQCLIKKEWITAIGLEDFTSMPGGTKEIVIIASQAIFPHFPEVEARYEDIKPFLEKKQEIAQPQMAGS